MYSTDQTQRADFAAIDSRMGVCRTATDCASSVETMLIVWQNDLGFFMYQIVQVFGVFVSALFVSPYMLLFAAILMICCIFIATRFLAGGRETKRLESNAKSPIFEQFRSALMGISTIRSFDKTHLYIDR